MQQAAYIKKQTHKILGASPAMTVGVLFLFVSLLSFSAFHFHPLQGRHSTCAFSFNDEHGNGQNDKPENHCPICQFKAALSQTTVPALFALEAPLNISYSIYCEFESSVFSLRRIRPRLRAPPTPFRLHISSASLLIRKDA
ncbi:hypothetical protein Ctha_0045 [Chloroherpeton thalassium ATCC 35110]|uniref:DUF2946 domain-containing protein n=1 Tax=Chloroherpeton thalassium (strain ATCC 35110 / GB-78) TaxID=517418 RepID=B3QSC6_CHLT3|nr:hypothetical protein [Chloroherpeton thalassium]ACF12517.1 hypothetical protein Ctha_0045 [Chloroherpeton thalassium ATCC 35110]